MRRTRNLHKPFGTVPNIVSSTAIWCNVYSTQLLCARIYTCRQNVFCVTHNRWPQNDSLLWLNVWRMQKSTFINIIVRLCLSVIESCHQNYTLEGGNLFESFLFEFHPERWTNSIKKNGRQQVAMDREIWKSMAYIQQWIQLRKKKQKIFFITNSSSDLIRTFEKYPGAGVLIRWYGLYLKKVNLFFLGAIKIFQTSQNYF